MTDSREEATVALATAFGGAYDVATNSWPTLPTIMAIAGYKMFGRRLKLWSQVEAQDKPCCFLVQYNEGHDRQAVYGPDKSTMEFKLVIYDDVSDQSVIPSKRMNTLLKAVDDVLEPDSFTMVQTLGDVVAHAWIEGELQVSLGDLDNQSVAVVPIKVLLP